MSKALPVSALFEAMAESMSAAEIVAAASKARIANQITEWRMSHNMNQAEFAKHCGVAQSTVSKWENGDFNFTIEKLAEIACCMDMELKISLADESESIPTNIASFQRHSTWTADSNLKVDSSVTTELKEN